MPKHYILIPPQNQLQHQDVLDFITDGCQTIEEVITENGRELQLVINPKKIGYKTQNVNSMLYGDFVTESEYFLSLAEQASYNMSKPMADSIKKQIESIFRSWDYGMDAKSSESVRDGHNAQTTLIDKFVKNKQERIVTLRDEAKKGFLKGLGLSKDEEERD